MCKTEDVGIKVRVPVEATEAQKKILRHMLGAGRDVARRNWGYRNRYCASVGTQPEADLTEMVKIGLVARGDLMNDDKQVMFYATVAGCCAIGLSDAAIKRAMED